jgi:hypothetical protein
VPEASPEVAIGQKLAPVPLERVSGGPDPVDRQVGRLELLDQPLPRRALDAAVQPARQDGGPVLDGQARLEVDLGAVRGVEVSSLVEDTGVDLRPEAEPAPAVAAASPVIVSVLAAAGVASKRPAINRLVNLALCNVLMIVAFPPLVFPGVKGVMPGTGSP